MSKDLLSNNFVCFFYFQGIAPKIEFSTRTAIRERVFLHRNRFFVSTIKNPEIEISGIFSTNLKNFNLSLVYQV